MFCYNLFTIDCTKVLKERIMLLDEIGKEINKLSGNDAKTLLLNMILRLDTILRSTARNEEKIQEVEKMYEELVHFPVIDDESSKLTIHHEAIHLVCGESPAGSLAYGLGRKKHFIIGLPDFLAYGPLVNLHEKEGFRRRHEWLIDRINMEMDEYETEYEPRFCKTVEQIKHLPENLPIYIWTAANANEQTGLRFFLYLLKNHANEVYVIHTTAAYPDEPSIHTGEIMPEKLRAIFAGNKMNPLTEEERQAYEEEWLHLSKTDGVLRVWQDNKIVTVPEDYYDKYIIETVKLRHRKQKEADFIKAARIIGEIYGRFAGHIDDAFLEYRLRSLIYQGVLAIKGVPKGLRYYSVKLAES